MTKNDNNVLLSLSIGHLLRDEHKKRVIRPKD